MKINEYTKEIAKEINCDNLENVVAVLVEKREMLGEIKNIENITYKGNSEHELEENERIVKIIPLFAGG